MSYHVKLYTISNSEHCAAAVYWLNKNDIKFDEINLDKDDDAKEELVELTGQLSAPTLVVAKSTENEIVIGFDSLEYKSHLKD
jgi:arsenate reductase-like glutaredoxin family protein